MSRYNIINQLIFFFFIIKLLDEIDVIELKLIKDSILNAPIILGNVRCSSQLDCLAVGSCNNAWGINDYFKHPIN